MSERLTVSVDAPSDHPDSLRVEDAFEHILDLFELAKASDESSEGDIAWRLVSVSMNSPLTVVAEAYSTKAGVNVDAAARRQKRGLANNLSQLKQGQMPKAWASHPIRRNTARNFATRNIKRLGATRIDIGHEDDASPIGKPDVILLTPLELSIQPILQLEDAKAVPGVAAVSPKTQIGSIEGRFLEVGTNYNQPALHIQDRRTGRKVWCVVSEDEQRRVAETATFADVWAGRRIVVSGRIEYDAHGQLHRVFANKVRLINPTDADLRTDPEFTAGQSASEYLDDFREGNLG